MGRRRTMLKMGLMGLVVLAFAGFATAQRAQPFASADRILLLQAKRFEGQFRLTDGETSLTVGNESASWRTSSGATALSGTLAPQDAKPDRATLNVEGRTIEGTASIEGKTLTMAFTDGKTVYRVRITLSGRNEGELSVTKGDATLISGTFKRA